MVPINKSKVTIFNRGLTSIFIVTYCLLSIIYSPKAYAEMKKVSGTSKQVNELLDYEIYYDQTKVRFENHLLMWSSADPDWDKAKIFTAHFYINPTHQGDDHNGCLAITHPNGDQTFIKYDGSWKWVLPREGVRWVSEKKGQFTGGTGKFEGIRGTFTSKGKGDGRRHLGGEWEVEYEIASTSN